MQGMAKTPVTIVTGFLGSGKTTLIRHVLEHAHGRRLALVINEFGDVGVDGAILKSCGIDTCPEEIWVALRRCRIVRQSDRTICSLFAHLFPHMNGFSEYYLSCPLHRKRSSKPNSTD